MAAVQMPAMMAFRFRFLHVLLFFLFQFDFFLTHIIEFLCKIFRNRLVPGCNGA